METGKRTRSLVNLVFKAISLAMAVAVVALNILGTATAETQVLLLGIGLFGLAINSLDEGA